MTHRVFAAFVVFIAIALWAGGGPPATRGGSGPMVAGIQTGARLDDAAGRIEARGFSVERRLDDLHALEVSSATSSAVDAARALTAIEGVRYAEPVTGVAVADYPGDPLYSDQSSYLQAVNAPQAWDITTGAPDVLVAVIDTGVDVLHADLKANIWFNPREIPNNGYDDDGNGCVDDVSGCAFVSDSAPGCANVTNGLVRDEIGHGTFVAGIIAAPANGQGMVGVARNVKIMPVKVLDCYGSGDSVATARGIVYAARNGAKILNLSLGGLEDAQVVRDAVAEAMNVYGALVIAATGNSGTSGVAFPARIPEVLGVGAASASADRRAAFSSYGPEVDVVAVGEDVVGPIGQSLCNVFLLCIGGQPYAEGDGTSFSTPQVSGLAALLLSLNRGLTPAQITDVIRNSATPLRAGETGVGAGRIDMAAAVKAVQGNHPPGSACVVQSVEDGESFTCGGQRIRMLQMDAPDLGQCGGQWAKDALANIFLTPGRTVYLRYDSTRVDPAGRSLAAPLWRGNDGNDYNLAIIMVYVGLAKASDVGAGNLAFHDWSFASETWARTVGWNMWAPGKTFAGGC
ncbi:MAG: S8 family serine peptidase [Chloroflexi bacterium]|nr:S8 family serine peptidase [Chloroflexota bacterium]